MAAISTTLEAGGMSNPSILLTAPGSIELVDRPVAGDHLSINPHEVLVHPSFIGVCGSDVHFWVHGGVGNGRKLVQNTGPVVMGHEAAGVIMAVGSAVDPGHLQVGDQVAIEPGRVCRRCVRCKQGLYNLCPDMRFAACPPQHEEKEGTPGVLSRFFTMPADFAYKLPSHVSLEQGVFAEPLAVATHAVRMAGVGPGETSSVVVTGAGGTIGILCAVMARWYGATQIVLVDIDERRVEFATEFLNKSSSQSRRCKIVPCTVPTSVSPADLAQRIIQTAGLDSGADVLIEASGAASCIQASVYALRPGGTHVQTGLGRPLLDGFPIVEFGEKELHFHGAFRYKEGDFARAIEVLEDGSVPVQDLVADVFEFERATEAWEATKNGVAAGRGTKNLIRGAALK